MDNPAFKYAPAGGRVYGPDGQVYWLKVVMLWLVHFPGRVFIRAVRP
jgi:hypothetical protein